MSDTPEITVPEEALREAIVAEMLDDWDVRSVIGEFSAEHIADQVIARLRKNTSEEG